VTFNDLRGIAVTRLALAGCCRGLAIGQNGSMVLIPGTLRGKGGWGVVSLTVKCNEKYRASFALNVF
jgi:hypothetical protein